MDIEKARIIMKMRIEEIPNDMLEIFKMCDAYWKYQGIYGEPHALLASGGHSNIYFNVPEVTKFSVLRKFFAAKIAMTLLSNEIEDVDFIVSSSEAARPIGQEVDNALGVASVFTEKKGKDQKWTGRFILPAWAKLLHIEELVTTLGTTETLEKSVLESNPNPVEFVKIDGKIAVIAIVHRPEKVPKNYRDHKVLALLETEAHNWTPEECPLCKAGSKALPPKPNWKQFARFVT